MWPELYINSKLVSLVASVRQLAVPTPSPPPPLSHHDGRHPEAAPASKPPPTTPGLRETPLALQPRGRRKLLEFSKSDVQDIMNRRGGKEKARDEVTGRGWYPGKAAVTPRENYSPHHSSTFPSSTHIQPISTHHSSSLSYIPRPSFH